MQAIRSHNPVPSPGHQVIEGFRPWQNFVNCNFPWLEMSANKQQDFRADVQLCNFDHRAVAVIRSDSCRVRRTGLGARRAEEGLLKVMWQQNGRTAVEQDGRETLLNTGDVTICDTARPYQLAMQDHAQLAVLMLPYEAIPGWERLSQRVCAHTLNDRTTARAALAAVMALMDQPDGPGGSASPVFQAVQMMLSALLHGASAPERAGGAISLDVAHRHVLAHIDDPELSPDELAGALHVSRRALYRLFEEHQLTPGRFIRQVRLDAIREALAAPDNAHRGILDIALDYGFTDSATFSRAFKSAFGVSPSEWRQR
ncbi:MAG: helix-turn-helix domain-containing protein [Alcanivorax sp.]|uniref:Helix-turn-helix domain-containing protein n=1 Tax=Alloalcanivorax marinus TaxID=1177169 RepID=A0A9Q3UNM6_9GAMM|nr:helix-turn-helix domain-containing protein [Alloalcanivorax marinus]MCC4309053.1 helix-turn-helix domain-containing protein [Alloalcanivorax marinus]